MGFELKLRMSKRTGSVASQEGVRGEIGGRREGASPDSRQAAWLPTALWGAGECLESTDMSACPLQPNGGRENLEEGEGRFL